MNTHINSQLAGPAILPPKAPSARVAISTAARIHSKWVFDPRINHAHIHEKMLPSFARVLRSGGLRNPSKSFNSIHPFVCLPSLTLAELAVSEGYERALTQFNPAFGTKGTIHERFVGYLRCCIFNAALTQERRSTRFSSTSIDEATVEQEMDAPPPIDAEEIRSAGSFQPPSADSVAIEDIQRYLHAQGEDRERALFAHLLAGGLLSDFAKQIGITPAAVTQTKQSLARKLAKNGLAPDWAKSWQGKSR